MAQPFDDNPIGSRYRERYGQYRSRYSKRKAAYLVDVHVNPQGTPWVCRYMFGDVSQKEHSIAVYQVKFNDNGVSCTGNIEYKIVVSSHRWTNRSQTKVYPFDASAVVVFGTWHYFGTLSTMVRAGEVCEVCVKSDDANDTYANGRRILANLRYARFE